MIEQFEYENTTFVKEETNINFCRKEFYHCKFSRGKFYETDFSDVTFEDCLFENCNLSLDTLHGARFRNVKFKESKLVGLNFTNCDDFIFDVSFNDCQIIRCNFSKLKMEGTIFSNSKINECDFIASDLRKANFNHADLYGSVFDNTVLFEADFRNASRYTINPTKNRTNGAKFSMPEAKSLLQIFDIIID